MNRGQLLLGMLTVFLLAPSPSWGNEVSALRAQIREILEQNKVLQAQLDEQNEVISSLLNRIEALEKPASQTTEGSRNITPQTPPSQDSDEDEPEPSNEPEESHPEAETSQSPTLFIRGFADTAFAATSSDLETGESASGFTLGELDLLITSQIAPALSVLSEMVFHFEDVEEGGFFEVERMYLNYSPSDRFNLRAGRMHTPLGYWNHHFHHGSWFQTTVSRPQIHLFEDDGGILPSHSVGAEVYGRPRARGIDFEYRAMVLNGRGRTLDEVQNLKDVNRAKAFNFHLSVLPESISGMNFGLSGYLDKIADDPLNRRRSGEINELILAGHLVYLRQGVEFLAEFADQRHQEPSTGREFDNFGFYVQGAYQFSKWKPYYRFDFLDLDEEDPLYEPPLRTDVSMSTLGLRWDPSTWLALKFEYGYAERGREHVSHKGIVQLAFVF